jgi:putative hydrolase of the HAD superfamily
MIKAVLWDFGGVFTTSPFEAFNRYEEQHGIPLDFIRSVNAVNPHTNAWAQFESSQVDLTEFDTLFAAETEAAGHRIPGLDVLNLLSGDVRPEMVAALDLIKQQYRVGCITNNVQGAGEGPGMAGDHAKAEQVLAIMSQFDVVIESSKVGMRKPDPRIYELACEAMAVDPTEALFIDDLGINLKPARAMGMTTIKVIEPHAALAELGAVLGLDLTV